ncbi:helix-turn-helix transcriptional regulator [Paenibacillus sp. NEAU-GSW1]|uniref:helix-turn-helix transcriptional regulator n=1 Tax=Paenibacillus sp. NEAU-GSW1 TaxID=2682486 RepID=UPI001564A22D
MELKPISCRIPEHLDRLRQTQQWLSDRSGIPKQQLNDYIKMRHIMGIVVAKKIADALRVPIDDLYAWKRQLE